MIVRPGTAAGIFRSFGRPGAPVFLLCLWLTGATAALGQEAPTAAADTLQAASADTLQPATVDPDTLQTAAADSTASTPTKTKGGLAAFAQHQKQGTVTQASSQGATGEAFFGEVLNLPKAGVKTDVRVNTFYSEMESSLKMKEGSTFDNSLTWTWDDYRQQDRTAEKRKWGTNYSAGLMLPVIMTANTTWDWSLEKTLNKSGVANVSQRNYKKGEVGLKKYGLKTGIFTTSLTSKLGLNDQKSVNQNQRNDFNEAFIDGGAKVGAQLAEGLTVASRLYGRSAGGDRSLGEHNAPSSAMADSVGAGFYYRRGITSGLVAVTRSNFDRKYLDWNRNSTGQIDTVGYEEQDKVVNELESKDALSIEFQNTLRVGRVGLETTLGRTTHSQDYSRSKVGLKEKFQDKVDVALTLGVGRDSFAVSFDYLMKWDDQRIKNATQNRGKQYKKDRNLEVYWGRTLFRDTDLKVNWHTGLGQDMAQNNFNTNDKDRLRTDLSVKADRTWQGKFRTDLLFAWMEGHDIAIHSTRSANNNIKSSYEVSPGYNWTVSNWITFAQKYRLYIQYTDYSFSALEQVTKDDNYNKRGNMNTVVTLNPTRRLKVQIKHDYNKRFNATKTSTDATGTSTYFKNQLQTINKINLSFTFKVVKGVTLEGATYRTRDEKESRGATVRETENMAGEIWVGARVNQSWGRSNPLELSAMVKKFSAYGPSVSESASDYWEADVWFAWEF